MGRHMRKLEEAVRDWLRSEERGSEREAEQAFLRVFALLPVPEPSTIWMERTLTRIGLAPRPVTAASWAYRIAVGLSLALASFALALVPSALATIARTVSLASLVDWGAGLIVIVIQRLAQGITIWGVLARVGEGVAAAMASPPALASLLLALIVSFGVIRALSGLLALERRPSHV
jgi:hypothetical protein